MKVRYIALLISNVYTVPVVISTKQPKIYPHNGSKFVRSFDFEFPVQKYRKWRRKKLQNLTDFYVNELGISYEMNSYTLVKCEKKEERKKITTVAICYFWLNVQIRENDSFPCFRKTLFFDDAATPPARQSESNIFEGRELRENEIDFFFFNIPIMYKSFLSHWVQKYRFLLKRDNQNTRSPSKAGKNHVARVIRDVRFGVMIKINILLKREKHIRRVSLSSLICNANGKRNEKAYFFTTSCC